jgi:glycosyltransferase involved in cell wall biosynthesis
VRLSLVVPCYNEAGNVEAFHAAARPVLQACAPEYEIVFVNDGSLDETLERLLALQRVDASVRVLDLSRNFGKEAALTAGLDIASGDAVIPMDADLQHPPELISTLLDKWREGYDVVAARRASRQTDHPLQRWLARRFYRLHNRLSETPIPEDVGDFRLMDRRVVEALRRLPESRRFMKGIFSWVGFRTATIDFEAAPRHAGKSRFNGWRLWNFALEGITSFSTVPLRVWTYLGGAISLLAFVYAIWIIARTLIHGTDLPGYPSLFTAILLLGGVQLVGIGVLGEYVGRIYSEVKQRPVYLVRQRYGFPDEPA